MRAEHCVEPVFPFMAKPCCEQSELVSARARPRVWGAESPPRLAVNEHPAGCLFNRENLALRENNRPSSCVSLAAVAVADHPARSIGELITPTIMHGVILSVAKSEEIRI